MALMALVALMALGALGALGYLVNEAPVGPDIVVGGKPLALCLVVPEPVQPPILARRAGKACQGGHAEVWNSILKIVHYKK